MARTRLVAHPPDGLVYQKQFITEAEERTLLELFASMPFEEIRMHGVVARRTALRFGLGYDYDRRVPLGDPQPLPDWLEPIRDRAAPLAGVDPHQLVQALVQRYPPGAPIGWHRDAPAYELVVGVTLGAGAVMRFRRGSGPERIGFEMPLAPRAAYVLAGPVRWRWEHHLPPAKQERYSITLRCLRTGAAPRDNAPAMQGGTATGPAQLELDV